MKAAALSLLLGLILHLAGCRSVDMTNLPELGPGRTLEVGGHRIFVRQAGAGPDVVLLHGLGDSTAGWRFIEPALVDAGYRVTVWDALGAGRSDKPADGDYGILAHTERLEEVLGALGIQQAVLIGHSLGGSDALLFTEQHPERVRALCVIDPAAYREGAMAGRWFWTTPLLADVVLGVLPSHQITRFGLAVNFHNHDAITEEIEGMYLREARREGVIAAIIAQQRQLIPDDPEKWEQAHRTIRVPTLILWGEEDKILPVAQGRRLADDVEGARLVVFPDVGHSPHLEAPGLLIEHVLPFLEEVGRP